MVQVNTKLLTKHVSIQGGDSNTFSLRWIFQDLKIF